MSKTFEARYDVDDGYAGGSRPHRFRIDEDVLNGDETDAELAQIFEAEMEEAFRYHCTPHSNDEAAFIAWARERIAERERGTE